MALSGMGVSIQPEKIVKDEIAEGELLNLLPGETFSFSMNEICIRDQPFSELSVRLIDYFDMS